MVASNYDLLKIIRNLYVKYFSIKLFPFILTECLSYGMFLDIAVALMVNLKLKNIFQITFSLVFIRYKQDESNIKEARAEVPSSSQAGGEPAESSNTAIS